MIHGQEDRDGAGDDASSLQRSELAMRRTLPWAARGFGVLTFLVVTANGSAQPLRIPGASSARGLIAAAEVEGAAYRQSTERGAHPAAARKCVDAYNTSDVSDPSGLLSIRSGDFAIGGDLGGYLYMNAALHAAGGRRGAIWWHPDHGGPGMPPLVIRGRSLTDLRDTVRHTTTHVATWSTTFPRAVPQTPDHFFFSGLAVPHPGKWLLIATSGENWGCFILTVV